MRVQLSHEEERYALDEGEPLAVEVRGRRHLLSVGTPLSVQPPSARGVKAPDDADVPRR